MSSFTSLSPLVKDGINPIRDRRRGKRLIFYQDSRRECKGVILLSGNGDSENTHEGFFITNSPHIWHESYADRRSPLCFALQEEIKRQYKLRDRPENLKNATELCEKSVAISGLVIEAMKKKHRTECDEYARLTGRLFPGAKFYYPRHAAATQLRVILKKQGKTEQIAYLDEKMQREGWGSGKIVDLLDL